VEGCVYSNEFFDALPVHRVRRIGNRLTELYVTEKEGRLVEDPGDPSTPQLAAALAQSGVLLADGQEGEVCLAAGDVMAGVGRILARGFLWTADYGGSAAEVYAPHRVRGTLRSFSKHQLAESPLEAVGERDITAHVDFTRLARLGAAEGFRPLVYADQGPYWIAAGEAVLKKAVEDLSEGGRRGREVRQLVHPGAFGGAFRILIQGKNVEGIGLRAETAARLQRLGAGDLVVRG
jgi:SAM-dependent MidA family methyltransferase